MFNNNLNEHSVIKNNNEIEWNRISMLCESFFNANCLDNNEVMGADGSENSGKLQEESKRPTENSPSISKKFAESNLNINNEGNSLFERTEKVDYRDPTSSDIIELSLTDSDYLRAKNRWYDFSDTELDFASAERMNYINLLTECFSNRNFGEYSSHNKKLSSNFVKPVTKDHIDSRLFSKKQDTPRKNEVCVENYEGNRSGEGDCPKTGHSAMTNNSASVENHIDIGAKNNWPNYQTNQRDDNLMHCHDNNYKGKFVTNLFRSEVEETGIQSAKLRVMTQNSPQKQKANNSSECCMRSQTENEEIRKRLENLERIMLTKISSYQFDNGCASPLLIGEQIGLESIISTKKVDSHSIEKSGIFPCRKVGYHDWEKYENGGNSVKRHPSYQKVVVDEGGNKIADDSRRDNERKSRSLKYTEQLVTDSNRRKDSLDDLEDSQQMTSFTDSWSEFEIENIFENNRWSKESSRASSSSSSKRSYVTSDYTLIRRRKKYHRGKRRGRNIKSRKDETSEKYCHETDKRRGATSEKRQSVKAKAFSTAGKDKLCYKGKEKEEGEGEIHNFQTAKGCRRIKQYCVIL